MDEFEDRQEEAIEAGKRNLQAKKLLINWCFHAEFARSGGRGMIEAATGLPIGHMGVQCKFSKKNSMHSWLLEDAIYDFYQNNCKGCKERIPIDLPNIMNFVSIREEKAEKRKIARDEEERERKQNQTARQQERIQLHHELTLEETFVFDLLEELDCGDIAKDDPRLEQLANLAPEIFTRKVIEHLLPAVLYEHLPYSVHAAKALHKAPLEPDEKLKVALYLMGNRDVSPEIIETILASAENLPKDDLLRVLNHFTFIAIGPPPEMSYWDRDQIRVDAAPIQLLFEIRYVDICTVIDEFIRDADQQKMVHAVKIILAADNDELLLKYSRNIFSKLMRARTISSRKQPSSSILHYFREAASKSFTRFPLETDTVIQSILEGSGDNGREESQRVYRSALNHRYREQVQLGEAQRIAFKRLLWSAVEKPEDGMSDDVQFFVHTSDALAQLAIEHFDELIGAAAILSDKYEQIDKVRSLELVENTLDIMEKSNKRTSIDSLQSALIKWAAMGAKSKGLEGIEQFLELYRNIPETQVQFRGNMIKNASKMLTGVESLKLLLPDWYNALMDENQLIRAKAAQAWEHVPYKLVDNFPDLFFESFSILLTDPYVIVHRSAVNSLRRRSFPEEQLISIKGPLWNLIVAYLGEKEQSDFVVDCIDAFSLLCISCEERSGKIGLMLSNALLKLEGSALYHAVDRLHYNFINTPGFVKVALKSIQDPYTRSISIDDCVSVILRAPREELQNCADDIKMAFEALKPFRPDNFIETLVYASALTKAENYLALGTHFSELTASIPQENRYELWRLESALVTVASKIEHAIANGGAPVNLIDEWNTLLSKLEKENEERAKFRDIPPQFFFED